MLVDSLTLTSQSATSNLNIESGTAFPVSPTAGRAFYLNTASGGNAVGLYVYNGTSWATGDITGVTAGTGLTGGGTSGAVTLAVDTTVVATLDGTGKIPQAQLPAVAITSTFVTASQAEMLALVAQTGDVAIRTDLSESFILMGTNPATLTDWQQLLSPSGSVTSVNGLTGTVTLNIPYDIAGSVLGKPANAATVARFVAVRAISIPTNCTGSLCKAGLAATAATTFSLQKNGTQFATMVVTGTTGAFSGTATSFAVGDILTVVGPATADATLGDIEFTIVAALA